MPGIAKDRPHIVGANLDIEILKTVIIFCGFGLTTKLAFVAYGLELGAAAF